jgi:hypothetical protein
MFPPGNAPVVEAVRAHLEHRQAWYADLVGPLVVPDTALRQAQGASAEAEIAVSVINTGGAGGLVSWPTGTCPGYAWWPWSRPCATWTTWPATRPGFAAAAGELDESVLVFVEIPYAPGWERAVEEVEGAGLLGKIRTGSPDILGDPVVRPAGRAAAGAGGGRPAVQGDRRAAPRQPTPGAGPVGRYSTGS